MLGDVVAGLGSCGGSVRGVSEIVVEQGLEVGGRGDFAATSVGQQGLGFGEPLVVWADDDGHAVDGGLGHVVNAHAETAAHVGDAAVAIDGGEQAVGIDDEYVEIGHAVLSGF